MSQHPTTRRPQKLTAKPHPLDTAGIPWIFRPVEGEIELKLPFDPENRMWIRSGFGTGITIREKLVPSTNSWTISRIHFDLARRRIAEEIGSVEVHEQYRSKNHSGGRLREKGWITRSEVPIGNGLIQRHSTYHHGRRPLR